MTSPIHGNDLSLPSKDQILADAAALPSPPMVVLELLRLANDEDVKLGEVADVVSRDAALAGELLKTVNSPAFGLATPVSRLDRAISIIGRRGFRSLLARRAMRDLVPSNSDEISAEIRRRSVVNATLARSFAHELDPSLAEEAFLVGLLGSLGHLALARVASSVHLAPSESCGGWPREAAERELLGYSTDEVSSELMIRWSMPELVAEAVLLRGDLGLTRTPRQASAGLIEALRLAQQAEHVLCGSIPGVDLAELMNGVRSSGSLERLKLSEILFATEELVIDLARDLRFEAPAVGSYREIVDQAMEALGTTSPLG
ncbi:MAG: HDOD domain-containing protein [Actinomycetota bacterium]|nr:HDOD domain-containing protein [Actinomycetota bacterium]